MLSPNGGLLVIFALLEVVKNQLKQVQFSWISNTQKFPARSLSVFAASSEKNAPLIHYIEILKGLVGWTSNEGTNMAVNEWMYLPSLKLT